MRAPAATSFFFVLSTALFGQLPTAAPKFEISDVHRSGDALNPYTYLSGGVLRGTRYDVRKATMLDLIRIAYGLQPEAVFGGPQWLEFDRFDIAAKAQAGSSPETVRLMLQSLLAERFKLAVHKDMRPLPAFALGVGKDKPKLREASGAGDPGCDYQPQSGGAQSGGAFSRAFSCHNITMKALAQRLHDMAGDYLIEPVVDSTGIEGAWDFDLRWNERSQVMQGGAARTTIFDAVEKQLGLSLTLKTVPAPVLVIDKVNEKPTDNLPQVAQILPPRELAFEVASVKTSPPEEKGCCFQVTPGGGLESRAMPMRILLAAAWDVDWDHSDEKIAGQPKWVDTARFDLDAKASTTTNAPPLMGSGYIDDDVRLMLRALLIERFKMKVHYEDRLTKAYSLVSVKPRMKKADPANRGSCKEARTMANDPRDVNPILARLLTCQNATMAQFAAQLQALSSDDFAYPVEDATGLAGSWDFTLSFTPSWMLGNPAPQGGVSTEATAPNGGISLAEAISKQLGLKLEMRKRMLPVLVIDHIEEKPAEN